MDEFIHLFTADSTVTGKAPHSIRLLKGHSMKKSSFTQALVILESFLWSLAAIFKTSAKFKDASSVLIYIRNIYTYIYS